VIAVYRCGYAATTNYEITWLYAGLQYCYLQDRRQHGYEHPKVIFPPGAVDRSVIPKGASSLGLS
jgi:hypothetical protein